MVLSERSVPCPRCGWILHHDGSCGRCGAEDAAPPCPPVALWDPAFKAWLFRTYMLRVMTTHGDDAERLEEAARKMLHSVAHAYDLTLRWATPPGTNYELVQRLYERTHQTQQPAAAGKD